MMEEKDIVEYLNNEGFITHINDYGVIFIDVTKYGMDDFIVLDLDSKEIVSETPIAEEVNNKIIKPLMLMLSLTLIDYPGGRYPYKCVNLRRNIDLDQELLKLINIELEKNHERQDGSI